MDVKFLFNSSGEWIAFRQRQHVFDERSNWIGWLPWGNQEVASGGLFDISNWRSGGPSGLWRGHG